eukprot:63992_1
MSLQSTITISNGVIMPLLGLGTSHQQSAFNEEAVMHALQKGVRLFDTASRYGTERPLGECLERSNIKREELFITSKLFPSEVDPSKDGLGVETAIRTSLSTLGLEYLDLYLIHWPGQFSESDLSNREYRSRVWRQMEKVLEMGLCRSIGVSNFTESHLGDILCDCKIVPHVNQIELNPLQNPKSLRSFCEMKGIVVEGYAPLAKGRALSNPTVKSIGAKHNKSPAQILIRWSLQQNVVTIPKSMNPSRITENLDVFDFRLSESELTLLGDLHEDLRVTWNPDDVR